MQLAKVAKSVCVASKRGGGRDLVEILGHCGGI